MGREFDINKWVSDHVVSLEESAATADRLRLREVGGEALAPSARGSRRQVTIIQAGWGSSGYYSREMLARDGPKVFPKGTHMYMNHPSATEDVEQPERRVEHLAAVLATTPVMEGDNLVAEADVFDHWSPVINAVANNIGVSIRAIGEGEEGEVDGQEGVIISALLEGISVDFVTKAGAGGKVGMLMESAEAMGHELDEARNMADWLGARIHSRFTAVADDMFGDGYLTRDERIGLSAAIGAALDTFNAHVDDNLSQLKDRDPFADPDETGVVEEGRDSGETTKEEPIMGDEAKQLSEAQESIRQLNERVENLETEKDEASTRADRAEDALAQERARRAVEEALDAEPADGEDALPELPERARERVVETALKGKLPTDEDGKLDKAQLESRVRAAVREEAEYLSGTSDAGKVSGMGVSESTNGTTPSGEEKPGDEAHEKELAGSFQRLGMSEEAAATAAKGR